MSFFGTIKDKIKTVTKAFCQKVNQYKDKAVLALFGAIGAVAAVSPARAEGDVDDLFAALNLTGLSSNIKTLMLTGAGIALLFLCYAKLKKTGSRI